MIWVCLDSGNLLIFFILDIMADFYDGLVEFVLNIPLSKFYMFLAFCLLLLFDPFFLSLFFIEDPF